MSQAMSHRFCMVFLDEAQDTYEHQHRVLDAVFRPEQVVIQPIGDPNQAIYVGQGNADGCWSRRTPYSSQIHDAMERQSLGY